MLGAGEEPRIVERGLDVRVRLQNLNCRIAPIQAKRARVAQDVQVGIERKAVQRQRGVDRCVGVDAVVVAEHHVQVDRGVLPVPGIVGEGWLGAQSDRQ
ncbi:hypothetical protein D3C80_2031780 [compost metagenome]